MHRNAASSVFVFFVSISMALLFGCGTTAPHEAEQVGVDDGSFAPAAELDVTKVKLRSLTSVGATNSKLKLVVVPVATVTTGGRKCWKTGFPKFEKKQSYGGSVWLVDEHNNKVPCNNITTATKMDLGLEYPDGEWRRHVTNNTTIQYGMGRGSRDGCGFWSSWARFETKSFGTWTAEFYVD